MGDERQFRFLIPPFFFGLSALAGAWYSGTDIQAFVTKLSAEQLLAVGAAIGASALPIGFLLTSISILLLRTLFWFWGRRTYEVVVPETWLDQVWPLLGTTLKKDNSWLIYAAATFDHELMSAETHAWVQRRWSMFHVSAHSCVAVFLSHIAVALPGIHETGSWLGLTSVLGLILGTSAFVAWRHVMKMLEFQSYRRRDMVDKAEPPNTPLQPTSGAKTLRTTGTCERRSRLSGQR